MRLSSLKTMLVLKHRLIVTMVLIAVSLTYFCLAVAGESFTELPAVAAAYLVVVMIGLALARRK